MENDKKKRDVLCGFVNKVVDERNNGKSLVFVDDKLLEWVDRQVDAGKYRSRSHAIECALVDFKEARSRGASEVRSRKVFGRELTRHLTRDSVLSNWNDIDEADRRFAINVSVGALMCALIVALEKHFGDDHQAKIDHLKERLKEDSLSAIKVVAFRELLAILNEGKSEWPYD